MSVENKKTLEVYDRLADAYLAGGILKAQNNPEKMARKKAKLEAFIKESLAGIPAGSKVLEIGSADGTNALYMKSIGYDVTASDISEGFLNVIRANGLDPIKFNLLDDKLKEKYFAIFCWRVFVHFTFDDFKVALHNTYDMLEKDGIFIFNVFNREDRSTDSEWVDFPGEYHIGEDRFFNYFKKDEVEAVIKDTGYEVSHFHTEGGDNNNEWLVYILKK